MKYKEVNIKKIQELHPVSIKLPASKSESNRALIIRALNSNRTTIQNPSLSSDTQILTDALKSTHEIKDVRDAGTAMRFLTAFYAVTAKRVTLKGTDRMHQRPIGPLVEALRKIGAEIEYLNREGFPPLIFHGFEKQLVNSLSIPSNVSSQFISALLMIAPILPQGLTLLFEKEVVSRPYIELTVSMMKRAGAVVELQKDKISVSTHPYQEVNFKIGSDWSASSYWYALTAITKTEFELVGLDAGSMQGDMAIKEFMKPLGVVSEFTDSGLTLAPATHKNEVNIDFTHCPDLAQTIMVVCALKGIYGKFRGLERLALKETDRLKAMQNELAKLGARLEGGQDREWMLTPKSRIDGGKKLYFDSYHDHRMAMALAPVCFYSDISINEPEVVNKSYPGFWEDMAKQGIEINFA